MNKYTNLFFALLFTGVVLSSCNNDDLAINLPAPAHLEFPAVTEPGKLINSDDPSSLMTTIYGAKEFDLDIRKPAETSVVKIIEMNEEQQKDLIAKFKSFMGGGTSYLPLNTDLVTISQNGVKLHVAVSNPSDLDYGDYLFPLAVDIDGAVSYHFIHYTKDGDFTPLSDKMKKPLPAEYFGGPTRTEPMRMIAYVETNDWDPRNMGNFILEQTRQPVFDYVVLFAANMNFNAVTGKRYISFNKELTPIIENPEVYIKPLQDRGIKVIIDILPNHQGVGYANFQSYEEALEFAQEAKMWTEKIGHDGWDVDEEYADYRKLSGTHPYKNESWMWFAKAMKVAMPDKLLTLYDYGHQYSSASPDADGKLPKDYFDQSWANYGEDHPSYCGIPNDRYGKLSIEASQGSLYPGALKNSAEANIAGGFSNLMIFNIKGNDIKNGNAANALSAATKVFYGQGTVYEGKYFIGPKGR